LSSLDVGTANATLPREKHGKLMANPAVYSDDANLLHRPVESTADCGPSRRSSINPVRARQSIWRLPFLSIFVSVYLARRVQSGENLPFSRIAPSAPDKDADAAHSVQKTWLTYSILIRLLNRYL